MPLGFERLNERTQRPNANINFIKPLASSSPRDQEIAKDFLERIAAQCYPVMKRDYVSVMALEEYPPNPEFLGRNFNAGEVIQLVLKDKAGRWLSFKFVQMVMMHELAHCKQMNHSKFFWQVRNQYADQMKELWAKKYEGEGLWGRGQNLTSGAFVHDRMPEGDDVPEHLCGGTYRRARGRKRKRGQNADKPKLSYAERQQKRIAKKFGVHGEGQGLGEDELVRGALEQGKRSSGKPRVAGSKRGRELRANAALARFEAAKSQQQREKEETPELVNDSETESDDDEWDNGLPILEKLGDSVQDGEGTDMFRVCGDGDAEGGKDEMDELRQMSEKRASRKRKVQPQRLDEDSETEVEDERSDAVGAQHANDKMPRDMQHEDSETECEDEPVDASPKEPVSNVPDDVDDSRDLPGPSISSNDTASTAKPDETPQAPDPETALVTSNVDPSPVSATSCKVCSLENDPDSPTCMACSNVLKPKLVPNCWRCKSETCKGSIYLNPGDAGRCGLCGSQKPASDVNAARPLGLIGGDVLRWD